LDDEQSLAAPAALLHGPAEAGVARLPALAFAIVPGGRALVVDDDARS
jgi:hypothetical protein